MVFCPPAAPTIHSAELNFNESPVNMCNGVVGSRRRTLSRRRQQLSPAAAAAIVAALPSAQTVNKAYRNIVNESDRANAPGSSISIQSFAAMSRQEQKDWLKRSQPRLTKPHNNSHGAASEDTTASLSSSSSSTTTSSPPQSTPRSSKAVASGVEQEDSSGDNDQRAPKLDDSSTSSSTSDDASSSASDDDECDQEDLPAAEYRSCGASKRSLFLPYWETKTPNSTMDSSQENEDSSLGCDDDDDSEDILSTPLQMANDASDEVSSQTTPRRIPQIVTSNPAVSIPFTHQDLSNIPSDSLLANLLQELSFTPRTKKSLSTSESSSSLQSSTSSILKKETCTEDNNCKSSVAKKDRPVTFDSRVQVIVFQEERPALLPTTMTGSTTSIRRLIPELWNSMTTSILPS